MCVCVCIYINFNLYTNISLLLSPACLNICSRVQEYQTSKLAWIDLRKVVDLRHDCKSLISKIAYYRQPHINVHGKCTRKSGANQNWNWGFPKFDSMGHACLPLKLFPFRQCPYFHHMLCDFISKFRCHHLGTATARTDIPNRWGGASLRGGKRWEWEGNIRETIPITRRLNRVWVSV